MRDGDLRSAPPVPPRRLKRKTKPVIGFVADAAATIPALRSERRSRLPPPPPPPMPPQRIPLRQRIFPAKISAPGSADVCRSRGSVNGDKRDPRRPALSTFGTTLRFPHSMNNSAEEKPVQEPPRGRSKDRAKSSRPDAYPPLFFTIQDFQEVMGDLDASYNRTLRNMTSFEPTPRPRRSRDPVGVIAVDELPESPESEVLFRVTTTNVPFEKCLPGWSDSGNDPNRFVFEDYVDRRKFHAPGCETADKKLVLFGDDTFDRDEEERSDASATRSTTRVRFLVDPPDEEEADFDSLKNIDSLPPDVDDDDDGVGRASAEEETQVVKSPEDEFGDVPFDSLLSSTGSSLRADPSEDSTSSRTDFQTILVTATVEKIPDPEKLPVDKIGGIETSAEDTALVDIPIKESEDVNGNEVSGGEDTGEILPPVFPVEPREEQTAEKSPLVKERRNSFLMNMLQAKEPEEKTVCKVVATHPKTPIRDCTIRDAEKMRTSAAVDATKNKLLGELTSSFATVKSKSPPATNIRYENIFATNVQDADSAEILSGVLDSVLLDNKLIKCNKITEEPIEVEKSTRLSDEPRTSGDYVCSQKTDQFIDKKKNNQHLRDRIFVGGINENRAGDELVKVKMDIGDENGKDTKENNDKENGRDDYVESGMNITKKIRYYKVDAASTSGVDKCAIVRRFNDINTDDINDKNNHNNNNNLNNNNNNNLNNDKNNNDNDNNDNNAMTPVDLSYDQSPKVLSIIPGSVRSFVKFYEIRGETKAGSNVGENHSTPEIRVEEILETGNAARDNAEEKDSGRHPAEIENDIKYTIVARKEIRKRVDPTAQDQKPIVNQCNDRFARKSNGIVPGEAMFSQTRSISVVHPARCGNVDVERDKEPATMSSVSSETTATMRSRTTKSRNAATEIVPENKDGSTAGETSDVAMSIDKNHRPVTKSSTAAYNGRYTFYCTV